MTQDNAALDFFAKQTGDTCWRLTSTQYFHSKEEALAALEASVALASHIQDEEYGGGLRPIGRWDVDHEERKS